MLLVADFHFQAAGGCLLCLATARGINQHRHPSFSCFATDVWSSWIGCMVVLDKSRCLTSAVAEWWTWSNTRFHYWVWYSGTTLFCMLLASGTNRSFLGVVAHDPWVDVAWSVSDSSNCFCPRSSTRLQARQTRKLEMEARMFLMKTAPEGKPKRWKSRSRVRGRPYPT